MTENEFEREGAGPIPIQFAEAAGLEGIDEQSQDIDPEIAAEVKLQEETRQAEDLAGPEEDAVEDPGSAGDEADSEEGEQGDA